MSFDALWSSGDARHPEGRPPPVGHFVPDQTGRLMRNVVPELPVASTSSVPSWAATR